MKKRRNRICRRIAVALTVALLVGQSHAFVLAEESTGDVQTQAEASSGEIMADGQNPEDNKAVEDQQDGGDRQDECVCGTKCAEDAVNTDCPVCAADYAACAGKANDEGNDDPGNSNTGDNDTENDDTENNDLENDGQDNIDGNTEEITDEPDQCVCGTKCAEDAVNADCPVCAVDYANCTKNAGEGVNPAEETVLTAVLGVELSEDEGIVTLADEGVEAQAGEDTFGYLYDGKTLQYNKITKEDGDTREVEVAEQGEDAVSGEVNIPSTVKDPDGNEYKVTSIGEFAFKNCSGLTSITIPASVMSIKWQAFASCSGLVSVEIPISATSIEGYAFGDCCSLTSVTIPDSVMKIGHCAFGGCSALASIEIPTSVTSVELGAFMWCSSLTSVTIPANVTRVDTLAFHNCGSLESVTMSENITNIGKDAFTFCGKLKDLYIVVSSRENLQLPIVEENAFVPLPDDKHKGTLHFVDNSKRELTGQDFIDVFQTAEEADGSKDGMWYGWSYEGSAEESLYITASASEGGSITPVGDRVVTKGGEQTFTITPNEGNRIKAVTVDGSDVTAELKDTLTRAQAEARYYTFTNIMQSHTIHAEFERDGGDNPNPNPNPGGDNPGGGDNPTPGADSGNTNSGDGSGGSGGGGTGDNSGSGNGGGNYGGGNTADPGNGNNAGNTQMAAGTETSSVQVGSNATGASAGNNVAGVTTAGASGQTAGGNGTAAGGKEPKTGDTAYWEVYATLAMIAGLTYLLLYVMEESRGMSEREKEVFVAAFIRWGKKGGAFRKCCAMAVIFSLLMYYHTIGKRAGGSALRDRYLGQAF